MLENLNSIKIDGQKLQRLRLDKGLTQAQVGERIGVDKQTVSSYETKVGANPSGNVLARLLILYGADASAIISDQNCELAA